MSVGWLDMHRFAIPVKRHLIDWKPLSYQLRSATTSSHSECLLSQCNSTDPRGQCPAYIGGDAIVLSLRVSTQLCENMSQGEAFSAPGHTRFGDCLPLPMGVQLLS